MIFLIILIFHVEHFLTYSENHILCLFDLHWFEMLLFYGSECSDTFMPTQLPSCLIFGNKCIKSLLPILVIQFLHRKNLLKFIRGYFSSGSSSRFIVYRYRRLNSRKFSWGRCHIAIIKSGIKLLFFELSWVETKF